MDPTQRLAKLALIYLNRCDLKGAEIATFVEVINWVTGMAEPAPMALPDLPPLYPAAPLPNGALS